ncbi:MAG: hypothetical protein AMXMBFR64_47250 [Myxococcales bacterium]
MKTSMLLTLAATTLGACGMSRSAMAPDMAPLQLTQVDAPAPAALERNHFVRDKPAGLTEDALREILAAPVYLEDGARIGVLPVETGYEPDPDLPLAAVPASLSTALEGSGLFEVTTEVSTGFPTGIGVAGLRELAARYRSDYLLLYRHRFVDRSYVNEWGVMWLTVLGVFFVPSETLESAGVLEATLFDVKTGTILFTVYERVTARSDENIWHNDRKRREMKQALLDGAAKKLADQVVWKSQRLAAARPSQPATAARPVAANPDGSASGALE